MTIEPKNFEHLIGECRDILTENQLKAHFTLYQGYVKKLNEIEQKLAQADRGAANYSFNEYSELKRREPVAYNGTVLHELYFENLGVAGQAVPDVFKKAVESSFGSYDAWATDMRAVVGSGHGWCLVTYDWNHHRMRNNFIQAEHHIGLFANQSVIIAVDAWEHAYFMDYGTRKPDYLNGVIKHLNWKAVEQRIGMMTPLLQK